MIERLVNINIEVGSNPSPLLLPHHNENMGMCIEEGDGGYVVFWQLSINQLRAKSYKKVVVLHTTSRDDCTCLFQGNTYCQRATSYKKVNVAHNQ